MFKEKIGKIKYSSWNDGKPRPFKPFKVVLKLTPELIEKNNREEIIDATIEDLHKIMTKTNDFITVTKQKIIQDWGLEQLSNVEGIIEALEYAKEKGKFK